MDSCPQPPLSFFSFGTPISVLSCAPTLQPDVKNGYILFRRDQTLLLQQLSQFPLGAHDDGPDALEGARTLARKQSRTANLSGLHL